MEPAGEDAVADRGDALVVHDLPEALGGGVFFVNLADFVGGVEPGGRPDFAHEGEGSGVGGDGAAEVVNALVVGVADFPEADDLFVFVFEVGEGEVGVALVGVSGDDEDGGVGGVGLDGVEPVFKFALFVAHAGVPGEEEDGAVGEEELMGGVVDFLACEVPGVELHGGISNFWMG